MHVIMMPDGTEQDHKGLGHVKKHYINPSQAWQDLCDLVAEEAQPLHTTRQLAQAHEPRQRHALLTCAYHDGYGALIQARAAPLRSPSDPASVGWHTSRTHTWSERHVGDGIVVRVVPRPNGWELWSAFRPEVIPLRDYECLPRDAVSVSRRRRIAEMVAKRSTR